MKLSAGTNFTTQLSAILKEMASQDPGRAKSFKLYLDSILYNLPSKIAKYKPSVYHNNPDVKDIEHQGCTVVFYFDRAENHCVLLGIIDHQAAENSR